jgi:hypothetical protein
MHTEPRTQTNGYLYWIARDAESGTKMILTASVSLTLASLALLQAATLPTPSELADALAESRQAWHAESSDAIEFRLDPLNSCVLKDNPTIAITQSFDIVTTVSFDDGTEPVTSHQKTWVIRINSSCDWSKLNLRNTVTHELGHILIGPNWHSRNPHSVMYWIVQGNQSILPEDREMLRAKV